MKLSDIIDLAKQGYKPSDIKELIELSETTEAKEAEQKTPETDQMQDEADAIVSDANDTTESDNSIDYKSLYEAEKDKTTKLQQAMTNVDISSDASVTDLDTVMEAVKSFM